jgi:metal-sulfur cluster biosynthetic enzyme
MPTKKDIENVLKQMPDPELGVSLWDMGLIYAIKINKTKGEVTITMTLTTIGCPLFSMMEDPIRQQIQELQGVKKVIINLVFDPPWSVDRMSKIAREQLGL